MLLSFIIPTYNNASLIPTAIDSIYKLPINTSQYEVIVIDDGSTDNTPLILEDYAKSYGNFQYYIQKNSGPGVARNLGIVKSTGNYIFFVDSDDFVIDINFKQIVDILKKNELDLLCLRHIMYEDYKIGAFNNKKGYSRNTPNIVLSGSEYVVDNYFQASPCLFAFRREFLIKNKLYYSAIRGCEDIDHTLITILKCNKIMYLDAVMYVIVPRKDSLSRNFDSNFANALIDSILRSTKMLRNINGGDNHKLQIAVGNYLMNLFIILENGLIQCSNNEIWNFVKNVKTKMRLILDANLEYSQEYKKGAKCLFLLSKFPLLPFTYFILKKIYFSISH